MNHLFYKKCQESFRDLKAVCVMKNKTIKKLLTVTLVTSTLFSPVTLANPTSGKIHFSGSVIHKPCGINTASSQQVITLNTENGEAQRINIPLINCQQTDSDAQRFSVTLNSTSEAIKLYDSAHKAIRLGQGNDEASFNAQKKQSLQLFAQTKLTKLKSNHSSSSTLLLSYF
ncbi:hypothetical protein BS333_18820 [Vibrio azureus]|nr:hypothetical protein BS333_18820 [Vibrio azureus]